jgi:hypothetical protein
MADEPKGGKAAATQNEYADLAAPDESLSRDASHSTYAEVAPPDDVNPPPGPMVEQTLGKPSTSK